jgi:TRAP-type mannitol/chloroaromatic compound transport system substrate-binding protein
MKRFFAISVCVLLAVCLVTSFSFAAEKREKFGVDKRADMAKRVTFKPSTEKIRWKMVMPWSKGLLFYDIANHFCDSVRLASAGRLDIKPFSAGELVPAFETFDAVSQGTAQAGHDWPGYWKGKNEAFNAYASVPFGLDAEGYNIWLYEKGGAEMMAELYGRYNLVALPGGQCGQELGLFSNKRATKMTDFQGVRVRTVGWYMDILNNLGASVSPLPGGEVYLALERGVIDAAEFVGPYLDRQLGLQRAAKYYYTTGWHETATASELIINKAKWNSLPPDLKAIVENACAACNVISEAWCQKNNAEAMEDLIKNQGVIAQPLPDAVVEALRAANTKILADAVAKDPVTKKVNDSYMAYMAKFKQWSGYSESVYHAKILKG